MKLYFERSNGEREYVSNVRNRDEAISLIYEDLHIRNSNFKVYYVHSWKTKAMKKFWT